MAGLRRGKESTRGSALGMTMDMGTVPMGKGSRGASGVELGEKAGSRKSDCKKKRDKVSVSPRGCHRSPPPYVRHQNCRLQGTLNTGAGGEGLTSSGGGGRVGVGIWGRLLNLAPFRTSWMWSLNWF